MLSNKLWISHDWGKTFWWNCDCFKAFNSSYTIATLCIQRKTTEGFPSLLTERPITPPTKEGGGRSSPSQHWRVFLVWSVWFLCVHASSNPSCAELAAGCGSLFWLLRHKDGFCRVECSVWSSILLMTQNHPPPHARTWSHKPWSGDKAVIATRQTATVFTSPTCPRQTLPL